LFSQAIIGSSVLYNESIWIITCVKLRETRALVYKQGKWDLFDVL